MWYRSPLADLFSSLPQGMNIQMLGNMNGGMQNMFLVLERWRRIGGCESGSSFRKDVLFYMLTAVYHYYTINIRDVINTSVSISYIYIPIISLIIIFLFRYTITMPSIYPHSGGDPPEAVAGCGWSRATTVWRLSALRGAQPKRRLRCGWSTLLDDRMVPPSDVNVGL